MSYSNYSRNKYRNLSRPICPINVIVQDDNIKKPIPKPIPHLYYPNYPYSGYPYPGLGYPDYAYGSGGYPNYLYGGYPYGYPYPGIRPYVEGIDTNIEHEMSKPKSRSIEKTILNPGSKNHPNSKNYTKPHYPYYSSSSSSSSSSESDSDYICHSKRDKKRNIRDPHIDPIFDPENIISKDTNPDMIPNRVFDEESIKKTKPVIDCNNQNSKNYTKPFAKLVSKFTIPEIKTAQETSEEKLEKIEQLEKVEKESLGNLENKTQQIQETRQIQENPQIQENQQIQENPQIKQIQKIENDKKIYLK
jgi:hypothetical protein